ncbi:DUF2784 domain-containing protein [Acidobacteria bacterium AH-259-G07]|nr:DUF2784 domain-containing protein [Acidobacteria bacterium AH-259-G07]
MYVFLDIFFLIFHSSLIVFNLIGWVWKQTRKAHLLVLSLTMCSWFGLGGIWYGFGYCPCTDWHWQVKRKLGESELPTSYVKYYVDKLTDLDWNPVILDTSVAVLGLAAFGVSIVLNWRDWRRARVEKRPDSGR